MDASNPHSILKPPPTLATYRDALTGQLRDVATGRVVEWDPWSNGYVTSPDPSPSAPEYVDPLGVAMLSLVLKLGCPIDLVDKVMLNVMRYCTRFDGRYSKVLQNITVFIDEAVRDEELKNEQL